MAIEVVPLRGGEQQGDVYLRGNSEVLVYALIAEFQLKNLPIDSISDLCQRGGLNGNRFHRGDLSFEICGFRFRFRSPRAAAISFQRRGRCPGCRDRFLLLVAKVI
jgi:hypothetical protein